MKCPFCGADTSGNVCEYCNSKLPSKITAMKAKDASRDEDEDEDFDDDEDDDMIKNIKSLCSDFQEEYPDDFSIYNDEEDPVKGKGVKEKLFDVLDIPDDEEILLIHDDTILHSGKSGFAITDCGFYVKADGEDLAITLFDDIDDDVEINFDSSTVYIDDDDQTSIACYTGSKKVLEALCDLCDDIIDELFEDDDE